jgi:uridylate kinase
MAGKPNYKRVLLKVSGEALMGPGQYGIDVATVDRIAHEVKDALALGVEVCMVIGGGNIFRGLSGAADGMDRSSADYMGMLATVMNALAMQNGLERYDQLSYMDVLSRDLKVMDASAVSLSRENGIPIIVFSIQQSGAFTQVLKGDGACTIVQS